MSRRRPTTVLLTGFEPFGGQAINPSQRLAEAFDGREIAGARVIGRVLPVTFGGSFDRLATMIEEFSPRIVICLGQAGGRAAITPERIAINCDDARIADNAGVQPANRLIVPRGPAGYFSTLPVGEIAAQIVAAGIPSAVSNSAGTYVCNHLFYRLMHHFRRRRGTLGGFVHVPWLPGQSPSEPSLPFESMRRAIEIALRVSVDTLPKT